MAMTGKNRIMIYGPKDGRNYYVGVDVTQNHGGPQ
jgi:hypothetical protein